MSTPVGWPLAPVSIHAPARGATFVALSRRPTFQKFQSTRPRGARRGAQHTGLRTRGVSIHAPARGATPVRRLQPALDAVSIHAPARGATSRRDAGGAGEHCFNPRAREGRDSCRLLPSARTRRFNPRAREGRDAPRAGADQSAVGVSIHAPARGATPGPEHHRLPGPVSIHAPARGATVPPPTRRSPCRRFNPRAREGRDMQHPARQAKRQQFQSTRPRGARPEDLGRGRDGELVSIHAPARGATIDARLRYRMNQGFNPRAREGRDGDTAA